MQQPTIDFFPPGVADKLNFYVYRLLDPRNGETFYVGRGHGNRVFDHMRAGRDLEDDDVGNKLQRIREIHLAGFEVGHVIHRHGMDKATSFHVEGALIDAYPGLTNIMNGHGSSEIGSMHSQQVIQQYSAIEANFSQHRVLLISVNRTATSQELYEAVRFAWKINVDKARRADVILATQFGIIKGVFTAHEWLEATSDNFPGRITCVGRYGFIGEKAADDVENLYINKAVPEEFRKRGAANPIKYTWNDSRNWSKQLLQQTKDAVREMLISPFDGKLHFKNSDDRFAFMTLQDMQQNKMSLVDRENAQVYEFANIDELLSAGWVID